MRLFISAILLILLSNSVFSQTEITEPITEPKTIEGQFDKMFRISSTYQTYKVIDKDAFILLKNNVLDSIKKTKKALVELENLLKDERESIAYLNESMTKMQLELDNALSKEDTISFFGIPLSKITYSLLLWTIIIGLGSGLGFFVFKFFRSDVLTKQAQENLITVEEEFEVYRKKSIEREQKLRRQLQDEINKHRNS
ncbi:hypothetical protein IU405_03340 [Polaribacter sp. BAL334]|jgi:hypothetical protein|uniref:hypothetical protein n=1 Tax=Polaribacter sp. BAL334 TaxID=1708178 RepID=UPI0018D26097|nr:hypothetical protein [Polaribacter sp. BAL334]MBG7611274.1 hypothetical protein [Polaribacter sp. BAL334]